MQSEQINELSAALAKAQGEMKHAEKAIDNTFFKSKYADLPAVIDAAKPHLSKNGLSVTQITDLNADGTIILITQLNHSSGQWIRGVYPVKPVKNDPQGIGSALTYARRYSYSSIVGVASMDEDDDGNAASGKQETYKAANDKFKLILKAIQESNDPATTWHENLVQINDWLEKDKAFYDQLVQAGAKRKRELQQIEMTKAGMPEEFNRIK